MIMKSYVTYIAVKNFIKMIKLDDPYVLHIENEMSLVDDNERIPFN